MVIANAIVFLFLFLRCPTKCSSHQETIHHPTLPVHLSLIPFLSFTNHCRNELLSFVPYLSSVFLFLFTCLISIAPRLPNHHEIQCRWFSSINFPLRPWREQSILQKWPALGRASFHPVPSFSFQKTPFLVHE